MNLQLPTLLTRYFISAPNGIGILTIYCATRLGILLLTSDEEVLMFVRVIPIIK